MSVVRHCADTVLALDVGENRPQRLVPTLSGAVVVHEATQHASEGDFRGADGIGDRGIATLCIPAQQPLVRQSQAAELVGPGGDAQLRRGELENVGSPVSIQHLLVCP